MTVNGRSGGVDAGEASAAALKPLLTAILDARPFRPAWWLPGGHAQTIWSPLLRRLEPPWTRQECLITPDDDFVELHWVDGRPQCPTVLLLHGLEGNCRSNYMVGTARRFVDRGWNVVALEFRSCSGRMNRAKRLYHSGETTDLDFVVGELLGQRRATRLYVAGVSLGGNVVAKWLGERGSAVPDGLAAAASISPPFDLTVSGPALDRALFGLYVRRFLRTLVPKAVAKERQFPGCVDIAAIRRCRSFLEFDDDATAALHGFADAWDYWDRVGCGQFLPAIRKPTLLVAAADDPFNPGSTLPWETADRSPFLYPRFTRRGGHVGFVTGLIPFRAGHWAEEQVERFFVGVDDQIEGRARETSDCLTLFWRRCSNARASESH